MGSAGRIADDRGGKRALVALRAVGWRVALVGGLAGIATSVAEKAMVLGAILGSPYPDTSVVGLRGAAEARG